MRLPGPKRVLFVQHQDDAPPGYAGERLRQHGAQIDVVRAQDTLPDPLEFDLIVPLGSDDSAYDDSVPYLDAEHKLLAGAVAADIPVWGICFGAQLLSRVLGGEVFPSTEGPEIGWMIVDTSRPELIEPGPWLVWHLDIMAAPPGCTAIARTRMGTHAYVHGRHIGTQFHPEATTTSARAWASKYRDSLGQVGLDYDQMVEQTDALEDDARRRAYLLTDRVLEHAGFTVTSQKLRDGP